MMSQRTAGPASRTFLSRCRCNEINSVFLRQTRRHVSSKNSKPKPQQPARSKPLPYKPSAQPPPSSATSSPTSGSSGSEAQPVSDLVRQRWLPIFGMGAMALVLGSVFASGVYHWRNDEVVRYPPGREPQVPTGRASIQSPVEFDLHLDKSEWRLGITKLRRRLAEQAHGHVLEVAIGAGRNLEHYDWEPVTEALLSPAERTKLRVARNDWTGMKRDKTAGGGAGDQAGSVTPPPPPPPKGVLSFTGIDISPAMLDIAMKRMRSVVPHLAERGELPAKPVWTLFSQHATKSAAADTSGHTATKGTGGGGGGVEATYALLDDKIRIMQCDAQTTMPPPPPSLPSRDSSSSSSSSSSRPPKYYDTIVQTFGLCSVRDPVGLIANMSTLVRPGTGRIIMVEHGLSWWELINGLLDRSARGHFERFGCWWNRDIEVIVRDAVRQVPGLEIVALERPGWLTGGTHLWVELRMASSSSSSGGGGAGGVVGGNPAADNTKMDGWFGLGSFMTVKKKKEEAGSQQQATTTATTTVEQDVTKDTNTKGK
ncbi:uncharacterized protein B0I36DRAFT_296500 [Microdochium trichocladiopsis]|uniref:S-adenosyl-L-methionine-dependent methyltransferase n=1 Tax=Microdochium trichocladiopsis TaxID=1682393 RepID=A0A9P9BNM0_9PEZI|nr:uncharacterized protein B0I36DRAFT_296500 [Microdochium trichocladiopsis]KAH7020998.1 hypothetical protein B0I36DRAFT_296500 [Microdochium trichocladiopsis]